MIQSKILKIIKVYQQYISPFLGKNCRFWPSCSQYCFLAIKKYGAAKGAGKGVKRILRCHPWSAGGIDLP